MRAVHPFSEAQKIAAVLAATSACIAMLCLLHGNQQVLVWPASMWTCLMLWPSERGVPQSQRLSNALTRAVLRLSVPVISSAFLGLSIWLVFRTVYAMPCASPEGVLAELAWIDNLVNEGHLPEALFALDELNVPLEMPREAARKHHNTAVILIQMRRPELAVEHLLLSLKYDPANSQAAYLLAVLAADKGRLDEARAMLDMALAIRPDYGPARRLQRVLASQAAPSANSRRQ